MFRLIRSIESINDMSKVYLILLLYLFYFIILTSLEYDYHDGLEKEMHFYFNNVILIYMILYGNKLV